MGQGDYSTVMFSLNLPSIVFETPYLLALVPTEGSEEIKKTILVGFWQ